MGNSHDELHDFYQKKYNEDERMVRQPLEFLRCKEIISRYLNSENMEIADIGGATGVFSYWLAQMGHNVHLLDYTPLHIEQAKENGKKLNLELSSYTCGDARNVPYTDNRFDLVLEMGPLYHLQNKMDRMSCLLEARRSLKNGGTIICEAISRYANIFDGFRRNLIDDDKFVDILNENLKSGNHSPGNTPYFTTAFFHTPDALVEELRQAGFQDISIIAVEGIGSAFNVDSIFADQRKKNLLLKYIQETESNPDLIGVSSHFMAIGKKISDNR